MRACVCALVGVCIRLAMRVRVHLRVRWRKRFYAQASWEARKEALAYENLRPDAQRLAPAVALAPAPFVYAYARACLCVRTCLCVSERLCARAWQVEGFPLFEVLDGTKPSDYVQRVEPSPSGGAKARATHPAASARLCVLLRARMLSSGQRFLKNVQLRCSKRVLMMPSQLAKYRGHCSALCLQL
eukprot:6198948-Pleurochrysis_carterae.AAC.1